METASSSKILNPTDETHIDTTEKTSSTSSVTDPNEETKIIHWSQWDFTYESSQLITIGTTDLLVTKYTRAHHDRVSKIWFQNDSVNEPENVDTFYEETLKKHEILTKKILKASNDYFRKIHLQLARDLGVLKNGISSRIISTRAWQLSSFMIFQQFLILIIIAVNLKNVTTEH